MASKTLPVTQMNIFPIPNSSKLDDPSSDKGKIWARVLAMSEQQPGFLRQYWGRSLEHPDRVHLHIGFTVRETLHQHYSFMASPAYRSFQDLLKSLVTDEEVVIRHASLFESSPGCRSLGKGAPFTGTAIYLDTHETWDAAWALWATVVVDVAGCAGVAGGSLIEPVDGKRAFIAWVGWDSIEAHNAYHHSQHFRDRRIILTLGNTGYSEYQHVSFRDQHRQASAKL